MNLTPLWLAEADRPGAAFPHRLMVHGCLQNSSCGAEKFGTGCESADVALFSSNDRPEANSWLEARFHRTAVHRLHHSSSSWKNSHAGDTRQQAKLLSACAGANNYISTAAAARVGPVAGALARQIY
mmetsp:Transcript_8213/g.24709  ORF Transcript_8213/g.24709 Transcript_8213/m.24709 type:complete len:127 (-) Transcript_8213:639-1019(-)